jgi:hypothetical protein
VNVSTYRELMGEQAGAAVRVSGAHHSSWNGRVADTAPTRKVRGAVTWDNTIEYSDEKTTAPLKEMFANARVYNQDPETLRSYREAVKTVFHENTHLLAAEGSNHSDAARAFQDPSVRALEEGITEVHSYDNLNRYIDDLGLEQVAPGISAADANPSYREFTPAARRFATNIGRQTGLESGEVVRRMAVVNAEQKFRVAAEMMYDSSDLPGMVPDQERAAAISRIEEAMKPSFARVSDLNTSDQEQLRRQSAKAGAAAVDAGNDEIRSLKQQWSQPAPEQQVQRAATVQQTRNTGQAAPPRASTGLQQPQEPGASALPADLSVAAHAGLTGSRPLTSASRLPEDRRGVRGGAASTPGQQRQTPETQR